MSPGEPQPLRIERSGASNIGALAMATLGSVRFAAMTPDGKLKTVTPAGLDYEALSKDLADNGSFKLSVAPDGAVLKRDKTAKAFILVTYSL
jgi:hypothetical protein